MTTLPTRNDLTDKIRWIKNQKRLMLVKIGIRTQESFDTAEYPGKQVRPSLECSALDHSAILTI